MDDLRKPILPGKGASDYERYLRTDELLSLQKKPEEFLHPDEMTFQVVHQASELLLKGVAWELDRARALIAGGDFSNSAQLLRRGNHMMEYPISMLHELVAAAWIRRVFWLCFTLARASVKPSMVSWKRQISAWMICIAVTRSSSGCTMWPNACLISMSASTCSAFII